MIRQLTDWSSDKKMNWQSISCSLIKQRDGDEEAEDDLAALWSFYVNAYASWR